MLGMTHVMPRRLCQHPAGSLLWAVVPCAEVRPVQPWGLLLPCKPCVTAVLACAGCYLS